MPRNTTVRHAHTRDIPVLSVLFDLYRQFYHQASDLAGARDFLSERLSNNESVILVAESSENSLLGFAQLYPSFTSLGMARTWILNDVYVSESARGLGIGRLLMNAAYEVALTTGARSIALETHTDNFVAKALYESLGYQADTEFRTYSKRVSAPTNEG